MGLIGSLLGASQKNDSQEEKPLMISQYPALYIYEKSDIARADCIGILRKLGFNRKQATAYFDFECGILSRYQKTFLTDPDYVKMWVFDLDTPVFTGYPSTEEEIRKEKYLTISEMSMIIDEAEWHFWNSHEKELSAEVWGEICRWRFGADGARIAVEYYIMIAKELGLPIKLMENLSNREGGLLNKYKWG